MWVPIFYVLMPWRDQDAYEQVKHKKYLSEIYPRAGVSTRGLEDKQFTSFPQAYRLVDAALPTPWAPNLTVMMDFEL